MFRIEGDKFFAEDENTGRPGTVVTPEWLNDVQEEISNVIEKANLKLQQGKQTQLYEAINSFFKPLADKLDAIEKSLKYSRLDMRGSQIRFASAYYNYVDKVLRENDINQVPLVPFESCSISVLRNAYEAIILCNHVFDSSKIRFPETGYVSGSANLSTTVFTFKITGSLPELGEDEPPTPPFVISSSNCRVAIDFYQTATVNGTLSTALQPLTGVSDATIRIELLANRTFTLLISCKNPFANYVKFPVTESTTIRIQGFRFEHRTILPAAMEDRNAFPEPLSDDIPSV